MVRKILILLGISLFLIVDAVYINATEDFSIVSPENMSYRLKDHRAISMPIVLNSMDGIQLQITNYPYSASSLLATSICSPYPYGLTYIYDYKTNLIRNFSFRSSFGGGFSCPGIITPASRDDKTFLFTVSQLGGEGIRINRAGNISWPISAIIDYPDFLKISSLNISLPYASSISRSWTLDDYNLIVYARSTGSFLYFINLTDPQFLDVSKSYEISPTKIMPSNPLSSSGFLYKLNDNILLQIKWAENQNNYIFYNLADDSWKIFSADGWNVVWHKKEGDYFSILSKAFDCCSPWWDPCKPCYTYTFNQINISMLDNLNNLDNSPVKTIWRKIFYYPSGENIIKDDKFYVFEGSPGVRPTWGPILNKVNVYNLFTGEPIFNQTFNIGPLFYNSSSYLSNIQYPFLDTDVLYESFILDTDRNKIYAINLSDIIRYIIQETGDNPYHCESIDCEFQNDYSFFVTNYSSQKINLIGIMENYFTKTIYLTSVDVEFEPVQSCTKNSDCQSNLCHKGSCIKPDLKITDIKPIQTIQDIPLIKNKATMVRVFVELLPEDIEELNNIIVELEFDGQKYYETANLIRFDGKLYIVPDKVLTKFRNYKKENNKEGIDTLNLMYSLDSFNFDYPYSPLYPRTNEQITIKTRIYSNYGEKNNIDNILFKDFKVKSFSQEDYKIYFQRWSKDGQASDFEMVNNNENFNNMIKKHFNYLIATYPIPEDKGKYNYDNGAIISGRGLLNLGKLAAMCSVFKDFDKTVFIVPKDTLRSFVIGEPIDGFAHPLIKGCVVVDETTVQSTTAHEIGHTYGFKDEYLDKDVFPYGSLAGDGWDVKHATEFITRPKISINHSDLTSFNNFYSFMDYQCINCWAPSNNYEFNKYNTLLEKIIGSSDPRVLVVSGIIYENDKVDLFPSYSFDGYADELEPGNYSVECLSASNDILCSVSFEASFLQDIETEQEISPFVFNIPYPENTVKIVLKHHNNIIKEILVSQNKPIVEIYSINNLRNENYELKWNVRDEDNDSLIYSIFYSHNNKDWFPFVFNSNKTDYTYIFNTTNLPGSDNSIIKIVVTDGINTAEAISSSFSVPNKKPSVFITRPLNNSISKENEEIVFSGWAYDLEDFELNTILWTSDKDGIIGTKNMFALTNLSLGRHNITVIAKDSENLLDERRIQLTILPNGDVNEDCKVDILDLIFIRGRLNQNVNIGDNYKADANGDGKINILDLIFVRGNLGKMCS